MILVLALILGGSAWAIIEIDIGVVPNKLIIVDRLAQAGTAKIVYVSKDSTAGIDKGFNLLPSISGSFSYSYTSAGGSVAGAFVMPIGAFNGTDGWDSTFSSFAKYLNKAAPAGPTGAKVAVVKTGKLLKIVGRSLGDTPIDLFQGAPVSKILTIFTITNGQIYRHCSEFDPANPAHIVVYKEIGGGMGRKLVARRGDAAACP